MREVADGRGRLAGKVAVVTGGASGIGRATVERFVAEGASVVVGDRDADALHALVAEVGDAVVGVTGDAASEDDVAALIAAAAERFEHLDIAFANAGIGSVQRIVDADLAEWTKVLDINLTGPFLLIKHAAPAMVDGGAIVVTASLNAVQPGPGMAAYCASKAGVEMLARVAALELGPRRIRVNAIGPGLIQTALTDAAFAVPAIVEGYRDNTTVARSGTAEEVAGLVTYLVSDEASFVTGSFHLIDGGASNLRYPDLLGILGV